MLYNNENWMTHKLRVDDVFVSENSPAHQLDIPDEFADFYTACEWVEQVEKAHGVQRQDFYVSNDNHGDNMGNAMAQGQVT